MTLGGWWWALSRIGLPLALLAAALFQTWRLGDLRAERDDLLERCAVLEREVALADSLWRAEKAAVLERDIRLYELGAGDAAFEERLDGGIAVDDEFWERLCWQPPGLGDGGEIGSGGVCDRVRQADPPALRPPGG